MLTLGLAITSAVAVLAGRSAPHSTTTQGSMLTGWQVAIPGIAPGACMSFAPFGGTNGRTVFLDPGHGGIDPGVVGWIGPGRC